MRRLIPGKQSEVNRVRGIEWVLGVTVILAFSLWTLNTRGNDRRPATAHVALAQVFLIDDVELPALVDGPLVEIAVSDGELVETDQLLARIDDRQIQLQKIATELDAEVARERAEDTIEVQFAQKSLELAEAELEQDLEINRRSEGAVPDSEIRRRELTKTRAELEVLRSELNQRLARMAADSEQVKVVQVEADLKRRRISAPFDGIITDVLKQQSEWVSSGEPVLHLIRLDRLRVDGLLSAAEFHPSEVRGREVVVEARMARGRVERFQGRVVYASSSLQAGNNFRVRAEVENRREAGDWLLMPGMDASMTILLQ